MHRAPALNFSVKRSPFHACLIVCMTGLALAALLAYILGQSMPLLDLRVILLASTILITSGVALMGWKRSPQGTLRWDGQHWFWSNFTVNPVCTLRLLMDAQRVALVSISADKHAPAFLWLEPIAGDASWKPLRRAIVSGQVDVDGLGKKVLSPSDGDLA